MTYLNTATVLMGADPTGTTDSTSIFAAAIAAIANNGGGVLKIPPGKYKANIVINKSGVILEGSGGSLMSGSTTSYIFSANDTLPTVKISDDTAIINGSGIKDIQLYNRSGSSQKGLVFAGGAQKCFAENIQSVGYTVSCVEFRNDDVNPCTFNLASHIQALTNVVGAYAFSFIDTHTTGTGWTTACEVSNFSAYAPNGYQVYVESAQTNSMSNGYIQCSYSGQGVKYSMPSGRVYSPRMNWNNVDVDNVTGPNNVTVIVDYIQGGSDYRNASKFNNISPFMGNFNSSGNMFIGTGTHTTGSITVGTKTLTVANATGIYPSRYVMIAGAGPSGAALISKVTNISGTTITITDNASSTVSSVDVAVGDVSALETHGASQNLMAMPGIVFGNANKDGLTGRTYPVLYGANATSTVYPWNGYDLVWDMGPRNLNFFGQFANITVSTITQSGTTVTVTTSGSHGLGVSDLIAVDGCNEAGVNGTFAVATYVSSTQFTYTSSVSQTLAGVTGSPSITPFKYAQWNSNKGRLDFGINGIGMRNQSGTANAVIYADPSSANFQLQTPDHTNGFFTITFGSGITTGTGVAFGTPAANVAWITGNGVLQLLKAPAPSTLGSSCQIYTNSSDNKMHIKDTIGTDGAILTSAAAVSVTTAAAPTPTASTTGVMMGIAAAITTNTSTRIQITASGQFKNDTAGDGATVDLRYGTGTAPINGAAITGTLAGIAQTITSVSANQGGGFSITAIVTGLTIGTANWIDLSLKSVTGGNASVTGVTICCREV